MSLHRILQLTRDCEAIQIPSGESVNLTKGTELTLTQSLGGSFTVTSEQGHVLRIGGENADALGLDPMIEQEIDSPGQTREDIEKLVWNQLRTCFDPEIPVNIVDLGLVYQCAVQPLDSGGYGVEVRFTLTAAGCGMGPTLRDDIAAKLTKISGVSRVAVEIVFDPPWHPGLMTEATRLELGMI